MNKTILTPINYHSLPLLQSIKNKISSILNNVITIENSELDINTFFNSSRFQYDAAKIINSFTQDGNTKRVICTSVDLFIPIFTFVFGLAKLGGNVAIVSEHRLRNSFYGLIDDSKILEERTLKEIVHEYGHLLGLPHCLNYSCVMASSPSADEIDTKNFTLCENCKIIANADLY